LGGFGGGEWWGWVLGGFSGGGWGDLRVEQLWGFGGRGCYR